MSELVTRAKYDAFISYSHGSDLLLAQALQHDLERFARPWYRPRVTRVFRDLTNLSASPGLWSTIEKALRSSSWFVLMASPASARSEWVGREVGWWTSDRGTSHLLIALTDGNISWHGDDFDWASTDALPLELAGAFAEEPIWVDLRMLRPSGTAGAGPAARPPNLGDVVAEFAAPIMGRDKDELIGKHLAERRRTRRLVAAVIAVMAVLVVLAGAGALIARDQRDEAIRQRAAANTQARVAISRALAAASEDQAQSSRDLSLLLAVESFRSSPTLQARDSLLGALTEQPYVVQYLRGASATVTSVSVVGDGDTVFSGHDNGDVMRWDLTESRPSPRRVFTVRGRVLDMAVDAAGSQLAVAGDDLVLADISQEEPEVQSLPGPALSDALAFSPDGELLVNTGCRSTANSCFRGQVRVWDLDTREVAASGRVWDSAPVTSTVVSPDSQLVALGSHFGDVAILHLSTLEVDYLAPAGSHPDVVESLAFSPDGRQLVSASGTAMPVPDDPSLRAEPTIRIWNVRRGSPTGTVTLPWQSEGANPFDIALSPDGQVVATAGDHTIVKLWDARTGQLQAELPGHHSLVGDLSFSASGTQLVSGDQDGLLIRWATSPSIDAVPDQAMVRLPLGTRTYSAAFSPGGTQLAVGAFESTQLWDLDTSSMVHDLEPVPALGVESLAFSPDGTTVVAGGVDADLIESSQSYTNTRGSLMMWDTDSGRARAEPVSLGEWVSEVAYSPDGDLVAVGGGGPFGAAKGGWVALFDTASWELLRTLPAGKDTVTSVAFGHSGSVLAAGTSRGNTWIWQLPESDSTPLRVHVDVDVDISAVAFSPDGELVALGQEVGLEDEEYTIHFADPVTGELVGAPLEGHPGREVTGLAFNHDGSLLVSSGGNRSGDPAGELSVWDVAERTLLMSPLRTASEEVADLSVYTSAGLRAAAPDQTGVLLWDLDVDSWQRRACDIAARDLTEAEWTEYVGELLPYRPTCP